MININSLEAILWIVVKLAIIIVAIMLHEIAHGYAAYRLGDPTAKNAGRLTLNPIKHLDPFGSVLLPLVMAFANGPIFAYAKPVPYNPAYFKDLRKGELIVAFAGPASNFMQALIGAGICWCCMLVPVSALIGNDVALNIVSFIYAFGTYVCYINLWLFFFNIIPLPPLDGASIVAVFLDEKGLNVFYTIKQYSMFILLLLLIVVPMVTPWDPIGWYFSHTATLLAHLMLPS
ncbi:MAG: site-2 protease family protein [Coriobacteriales bacterium]|nr:site-2 protease family protein [Coriobacteriales bacterium]